MNEAETEEESILRELAYHIELQQAEYARSGIPLGEADRLAHIAFGGLLQTKEACLEAVRTANGSRRLWYRLSWLYKCLRSA